MKILFETSYRKMSYKWQMVRQQLGQADNKDWMFHTCRHTCASRLAEAGATFMEVCDWMGWSLIHQLQEDTSTSFLKTKIKMAKKLDEHKRRLKVVSGGIK